MSTVRRHTRRVHGQAVPVRQHRRVDNGPSDEEKRAEGRQIRRTATRRRRRGLNTKRVKRNLKRAFKAARKHRKGKAALYGSLAVAELGGFVALRGMAFVLLTVGVVAMTLGAVAAESSGRKPKHRVAKRRASRTRSSSGRRSR